MSNPAHRAVPLTWLLLPGAIMSVGWGLRGFIGGGSLGAMIPGALVALALCFLLKENGGRVARIAACGAIGVGLGGQETYGQTMQFIARPEMFWLGLAGVTVKGAVWGVVGGVCLGTGFLLRAENRRPILMAMGWLVAGTFLGWYFIDEPKLLYFSNRLDRPRPELWAGLLAGGLCYLGGLSRAGLARVPARFALAGAVGGGIGFPLGAWFMLAGRTLGLAPESYPGWKIMEFTFGLCFGVALGLCAYWNREKITAATSPTDDRPAAQPALSVGLALLAVAAIWAGTQLPLRFSFTVTGAVVLAAAMFSDRLAWQVALTVAIAAFTRDVADFLVEQQPAWALLRWVLVVSVPAVAAWSLAVRTATSAAGARFALLLLLWLAVAAAIGRTLLYQNVTLAQGSATGIFVLLAGTVTLLVRRVPAAAAAESAPP